MVLSFHKITREIERETAARFGSDCRPSGACGPINPPANRRRSEARSTIDHSGYFTDRYCSTHNTRFFGYPSSPCQFSDTAPHREREWVVVPGEWVMVHDGIQRAPCLTTVKLNRSVCCLSSCYTFPPTFTCGLWFVASTAPFPSWNSYCEAK